MGQCIQCNSRPMTHVANGYGKDIQACVKTNSIEVYEEEIAIEAQVGASGLPVAAGVAHNIRQKRNYVTHDPGFSIIKPGSHLGFAAFGADGHVFVTIKIGSDIPHANFQVYNGRNVIVAKDGSLRNAKDKEIWTDTLGENHTVVTPANAELVSSAEGLLINQDHVDGGPRTSERKTVGDPDEYLRRYRMKGRVKKYFGSFGDAVGQMNRPHGICSTAADDIVVADRDNNRVQIFDVYGKVKGVFGSEGTAEGQFNRVLDVCVTSHGRIVASDCHNNRIQIFDEQGKFVRTFGSIGSGYGELDRPFGVAANDKGLIYVCDLNRRVQVFSEDGKFVREFGSESLNKPQYLSLTSNGKVVVSDSVDHKVHVFDSYDGRHLFQFGRKGTNDSQFDSPQGIATDYHGNIIVCDNGNNRVQVFTRHGQLVTCFGSDGSAPGQMSHPQGVCVLSDGGIAICEFGNSRVQIF